MLGDISDAFLRRHMTVARVRLLVPPAVVVLEEAEDGVTVVSAAVTAAASAAESAALQAAKTAHLILPGLAPYQLTDCFTDVAAPLDAGETGGGAAGPAGPPGRAGLDVTVTLQGYHRAPIDGAALLAAAAAAVDLGTRLSPARPGQAPAWSLHDLRVVQSVQHD